MYKLIVPMLVLFLAGCVSVPKEVRLPEGTTSVTYTDAVKHTAQVQGQPVLWGGMLADIKHTKDKTILEIAAYPLHQSGRPDIKNTKTLGRFRVVVDQFLDPVEYAQRRLVTIRGTLNGVQEGKIDDYVYRFPVVNGTGVHLWDKEPIRARVQMSDPWLWGGGYWGGYWGQPFYPVARPVIVTPRRSAPVKSNK